MKYLSLLLTFLLSSSSFAQNSGWNEVVIDPIAEKAVRDSLGIAFVDSNGVARIIVGAYTPNPVINGKRYRRDVQISGITFQDQKGNETGGIGVMNGTRTSVLAFDYTTREALVIWTADDSLCPSTGLMLNERLTQPADTAGRSRLRLTLSIDRDIPSLVFFGKDGTPRLTIGLDSLDNPVIEVIDRDGKKRNLVE